jgi:hypothetical protein
MFRAFGLLAVLTAGCSEYHFKSHNEVLGEPNPRDLPSVENTDQVLQVPVPQVDVLFVVDNSSSMGPEQASLARAFPAFLAFFLDSGLDYHVGVVATDMDRPEFSGKLSRGGGVLWIDSDTENPEAVFAQMTDLGTITGSVESGRAAAYTALELRKDEYNDGFSRKAADLHIVAISDDEDQSGNNPIGLDEFIGWLQDAARPDENTVTFNSIVNAPGPCEGDCAPGYQYMEATEAVGGILWDITSDDWDQVLELLGIQAASLKHEFFLSQLPVEGTIDVEVHTEEATIVLFENDDWLYSASRNSVTLFTYVPDPLATISIHYEVLSAE